MRNGQTECFGGGFHPDYQQLSGDFIKICSGIKEKGYRVSDQLIGYFLSKDPSYITKNNDARKLILKYDVDILLDFLIQNYLNGKEI